jgi:hypothetical protein
MFGDDFDDNSYPFTLKVCLLQAAVTGCDMAMSGL